jgi:hypothetical protein
MGVSIMDVKRMHGLKMDIQTEEIVADFLASYGREVIYTADSLMDNLMEKLA